MSIGTSTTAGPQALHDAHVLTPAPTGNPTPPPAGARRAPHSTESWPRHDYFEEPDSTTAIAFWQAQGRKPNSHYAGGAAQ